MKLIAAFLLLASAEESYKRGVELFQKGQTEPAVAALSEAARLAPRNARIWKALGVVYASTGDYERALEPFERACSLAPALEDACYFHGRNLYALNRFGPAMEALQRAVSHDKPAPKMYLGLAQAQEALGKAAEAERTFRDAIREYQKLPTTSRGLPDFDPRVHYALFLFRQGRQSEALAPAQEAVRDSPSSGKARYELGRILYHLNRLPEAEAEFRKAVEFGFGSPAALMLAKTLLRLGRESEAQPYLRAEPQ